MGGPNKSDKGAGNTRGGGKQLYIKALGMHVQVRYRILLIVIGAVVGLVVAAFILRGHGLRQGLINYLYQQRVESQSKSVVPNAAYLAKIQNAPYPRVYSIYLKTPLEESDVQFLAHFAVVILGVQAQEVSPYALGELRTLNPNILLLAYVDPVEFPKGRLKQIEPQGKGPWHYLGQYLQDSNYLRTSKGAEIDGWPGMPLLNLTSSIGSSAVGGKEQLADFMARYYVNEVLGTGYWDGIFFDTTWPNISWIAPDIDVNGDGRPDSHQTTDSHWNSGLTTLFSALRGRVGNRYLLVGNDKGKFFEWLNGRMFEDFPAAASYQNPWPDSMNEYRWLERYAYKPELVLINSSTRNTGDISQRELFYGLTSTLLGDGFFTYDKGSADRSSRWWFRQYTLDVGRPLGPAQAYDPVAKTFGAFSRFGQGVYERRFTKATILVNSSAHVQQLEVNNQPITLQPKSGAVVR